MTATDARKVAQAARLELGTGDATADQRRAHARALMGAREGFAEMARADPAEWLGIAGEFAGLGLRADMTDLKQTVKAINEKARQDARAAAAKTQAGQADASRRKIRAMLSTTEKGKVTACDANITTILRLDPRWASLRMSTLGNVVEVDGDELVEGQGAAYCCEWLRDQWGIEANMRSVTAILAATAKGRPFSPVREYLERVRPLWKPSMPSVIGDILPDILGIKPSADEKVTVLRRAMVGRFLIGAVARALNPGCRHQTALILVGDQGAKKSTFFATLFGEWFGDSPIPIGDKDAPIQLARVWGYEASELEDLTTKRSVSAIKQFMATSADNYRAPYEANSRLHPRHSVLCGSSNPSDIITDPSGSRRFWVLTVPRRWIIPVGILASWRDQIWSEALHAYGDGSGNGTTGEPWWFAQDEDDVRDVDAQQYVVEDPWQSAVESWLWTSPDAGTPAIAPRPAPGTVESFTTAAVLTGIGLEISHVTQTNKIRVNSILRRLHWSEVHSPAGYRNQRVWRLANGPNGTLAD